MTGFVPSEGQRVLDVDVPDDDVPSEPRPDFLNTLQVYKDRALLGKQLTSAQPSKPPGSRGRRCRRRTWS